MRESRGGMSRVVAGRKVRDILGVLRSCVVSEFDVSELILLIELRELVVSIELFDIVDRLEGELTLVNKNQMKEKPVLPL